MLRMEIALFLVLVFLAYFYFFADKKITSLHKIFSQIMIIMIVHMLLDMITIYTVNHLDDIPRCLNDLVHRLFIGTMVFMLCLFFQYIVILVDEAIVKINWFKIAARIFLIGTLAVVLLLPLDYEITSKGNYCSGIPAWMCYISVGVYLLLCAGILMKNWKRLESKKKFAIAVALIIEACISLMQAFNPTWLISSLGLTLMTLAFYLTLENPDILRAELTEQKMSMLYLKSQVNPHFLYNTLDSIRIQAQLNDDKKVADLLMRLVDFFRLSVKVDRQMVALDDELELLEAYMELMCYRYPKLVWECDIDPELGGVLVPNFILQPIVENSLLHGLKNKGYCGMVRVAAKKMDDKHIEIQVVDTGTGFLPEKKQSIDSLLENYETQAPKLEGNSIGIIIVQKRIKLLCGRDCGLFYTNNEQDGVTAHLVLSMEEGI